MERVRMRQVVIHAVEEVSLIPLVIATPRIPAHPDRKSTRLNSSHSQISYAVFCLKKKKQKDAHEKNVERISAKTAIFAKRFFPTSFTFLPHTYIDNTGLILHHIFIDCRVLHIAI